MAATLLLPSSAGPVIGELGVPSARRVRPSMVPCCDSTQPTPASVVQPRRHDGSSLASRSVAAP